MRGSTIRSTVTSRCSAARTRPSGSTVTSRSGPSRASPRRRAVNWYAVRRRPRGSTGATRLAGTGTPSRWSTSPTTGPASGRRLVSVTSTRQVPPKGSRWGRTDRSTSSAPRWRLTLSQASASTEMPNAPRIDSSTRPVARPAIIAAAAAPLSPRPARVNRIDGRVLDGDRRPIRIAPRRWRGPRRCAADHRSRPRASHPAPSPPAARRSGDAASPGPAP